MIPKPRDPLLGAARIILIFMMAGMALAVVLATAAIPAALIFRDQFVKALVGDGFPPEAAWAMMGVAAIIVVAASLGFLFFRHLYRIVGSVGEGDPFTPENAKRLSSMGWIVVGVNLLAIPLVGIIAWLARISEEVRADLHANGGLDFGGILLALILFILARVFREGTRMREELEGTV